MLNPYRPYREKTGTKQLTQEAEGGASCVSFKRPDTVQAPRPLCLRVSSPVTDLPWQLWLQDLPRTRRCWTG